MAKIPVIHENEDGWSDWQDIGKKFRILCCDCSLAHDWEFKIVKDRLLWRVSVNSKSTAAARRKKKKNAKV